MALCICLVSAAFLFLAVERMLFMAPTPFGGTVYFVNVIQDMLEKRLGLSRVAVDSFMLTCALIGCIGLGPAAPLVAFSIVSVLALLQLYVNQREISILTSAYSIVEWKSHVDPNKPRPTGHPEGIPSPSAEGILTCSMIGPFLRRMPQYDLGDLIVGRRLAIRVVVANHSKVALQAPIDVNTACPEGLKLRSEGSIRLRPLTSGEFDTFEIELAAESPCQGELVVNIGTLWQSHQLRVRFRITSNSLTEINLAKPHGFPGACRSAFAWRGDMDLYDIATFQSIEGLESTLSMAARYRMPQTMYLSSRLTLDHDQARDYYQHYGVTRGEDEIPHFIEWMQKNVEFGHDIRYPFNFERPYAMELGNHGHLHYGTDAAASADNEWKFCARMGDGKYPWTLDAESSLEEQRDNALETRRTFERLFDYTPKSWAMPDRTSDKNTPRAMELAGCEVLSDSNVRTVHNVVYQPKPHHPIDTAAVELTKRYPGDPQHAYHVAMNLFWIHRAHRLGIPVVFMGHQHLNQFVGTSCIRMTESIVRHVLDSFNGDLHVNTVFGIGAYWKDVFSPIHRCVQLQVNGRCLEITNEGERDHKDFSVLISLSNGEQMVYLLDLAAKSSVTLSLDGSLTANNK